MQSSRTPGVTRQGSLRTLAQEWRINKLLAVPAALYACNNYLKFGMQLYFKPTTAKMLGNLKVGSSAFLDWLLPRRGITSQHVGCGALCLQVRGDAAVVHSSLLALCAGWLCAWPHWPLRS